MTDIEKIYLKRAEHAFPWFYFIYRSLSIFQILATQWSAFSFSYLLFHLFLIIALEFPRDVQFIRGNCGWHSFRAVSGLDAAWINTKEQQVGQMETMLGEGTQCNGKQLGIDTPWQRPKTEGARGSLRGRSRKVFLVFPLMEIIIDNVIPRVECYQITKKLFCVL